MDDKKLIIDVIRRQFESMHWNNNTLPDWDAVRTTFHKDARCFPSRRPAMPITAEQFIQRMEQLRTSGKLHSFSEKICFYDVQWYPNIASVTVGCEMTENLDKSSFDISVINMIFDEGRWQICSQAWSEVSQQQCQLYFSQKEYLEQ